VEYNLLNLPKKVSKGTENISYIYSATGTKLAMLKGTTVVNFYAGMCVYKGNKTLDYALHPEGVVRATGQGLSYEYFLKDHLGNTRVVFGSDGAVLQTTDYYPFGVAHTPKAKENENRYLYNGKEQQDALLGGVKFDWYDYGARFYDPAIAHWHIIDPMIEKHHEWSSYAYVYNNPINSIDLFGLDTFNINIHNQTVNRITVENSENHVYVLSNEDGAVYTQTLAINEEGLVEFPSSGDGYGRYGTEDEGGDHYLNPETAAALFGLVAYARQSDENFQVNFGDMSDSEGKAPGGNHQTHGGPKGYSGDCIDFRYLNKDNQSYQGQATNSNFSPINNYLFLQKAKLWGFTKNYISNQNVWNYKPNVSMSPNGKKIGGHNAHGHLTLIKL